MWTYSQRSGELKDSRGNVIAVGYSGNGEGLNNPTMQKVIGTGPIPVGLWRIGKPYDSPKTIGPYALPLTPAAGTNTWGRSAFRVHGDNKKGDHSASHGCIILPRVIRERIYNSGDLELQVTV